MNKEEELTDILRKVECGQLDSTVAFDRILRLFSVVGRSEQLPPTCIDGFDDDKFCDRSGKCEWCRDIRR